MTIRTSLYIYVRKNKTCRTVFVFLHLKNWKMKTNLNFIFVLEKQLSWIIKEHSLFTQKDYKWCNWDSLCPSWLLQKKCNTISHGWCQIWMVQDTPSVLRLSSIVTRIKNAHTQSNWDFVTGRISSCF